MLKLEHIAIYTDNLVKSVNFYRDFLKLPFIEQLDMDDHTLTYFQLGDESLLELVSYHTPRDKAVGSSIHIAFLTNDISALREGCESYGAKILMEPAYIEKLQSTRMMIKDCNGVEIEFIQQPSSSSNTQ